MNIKKRVCKQQPQEIAITLQEAISMETDAALGSESGSKENSTQKSSNESADTMIHSQLEQGTKKNIDGHNAQCKYKLCLRAEIVGLSVVIVTVWGLLSLPIVFYHIQQSPKLQVQDGNSTTDTPPPIHSCDITNKYTSTSACGADSHCKTPVPHTDPLCQLELSSLRKCLQNSVKESSHVLVVTEANIENAKLALDFVDTFTSEACAVEVKPFLCLYFFGLCDPTSCASYEPTASNCRNLRDNVCAIEWSLASRFIELPECDAVFSDKVVRHDIDIDDTSTNEGSGHLPLDSTDTPLTTSPPQVPRQTLNCSNITCREGFYCLEVANTALCNPSWYDWNQYSSLVKTTTVTLLLLSACTGVLCGIGVLITAGRRRKELLIFPSSLAIYQTITLMSIGFFVIVNYMDRKGLYCIDRDLYKSIQESKPFCIISGATFIYCLLQLALFWFCHVLAIFWKIQFPFHARAFQMAKRTKYVHIASIAIGILLPTIPVIAIMAQSAHGHSPAEAVKAGLGFVVVTFPPILCSPRNDDITFYSLILPILVILMIGMPVLIMIFWIIHKQHGLFKVRQFKNPYKIGTAERKILIVFVYYVVLAVVALLTYTLITRDLNIIITEILKYFECESKGVDPANPCDTSGYRLVQYIGLPSLSHVILGLFPAVNFIYVINIRELKQYLKNKFQFLFKKRKKLKIIKIQVSDTLFSGSSSSTTGILPSSSTNSKKK